MSFDGWLLIPNVPVHGGEIGFDLPHLAAEKREHNRMIRRELKRQRKTCRFPLIGPRGGPAHLPAEGLPE